MKRCGLLMALLFAGGCYGYYPVTTAAPVGRDVQLTLTDSGSFALSRQIGQGVEAVSGRVANDSAGTIVLAVSGTRRRDGVETDWRGERLGVPRAYVASLAERKFSRSRTVLFSGIVAGTLYALREAFGGNGYSSPGNGLPGTGSPR